MSHRPADEPPRAAPARPFARLAATLATVVLVCGACALGERPTIEATPTAVGTMTGDPAIDQILDRLDAVGSAVFTASYTAVLAFGSTASTVAVTQDGTAPTARRRSVTIGDVRYINTPGNTSTCSVTSARCTDGIDPARVSDTGVTPDFAFGDMAKRLRRDATARIGTAVTSTRDVAGATSTCVDLPVTGGTKQYCVFDDGVLARYIGGDLTLDVDTYSSTVDESLFVV
jgi:hypothetical protein